MIIEKASIVMYNMCSELYPYKVKLYLVIYIVELYNELSYLKNFFYLKTQTFYGKKNTKDFRLLVLEKKSLHERAVGDPVQDPEIVPSKRSKIETNMPLTRSKVCFFMWF